MFDEKYYRHREGAIIGFLIKMLGDREITPLIIKLLQPSPSRVFLDVGCGIGKLSHHIGNFGSRVLGIDYSPYAISCAKEKYESKNVRFKLINAPQMNFTNEFDGVVCWHVIEHLSEPEGSFLLARIYSSLKNGGCFALGTPLYLFSHVRQIIRFFTTGSTLGDKTHKMNFSASLLEAMITSAGFTIKEVHIYTMLGIELPRGLVKLPLFREILAMSILVLSEKKSQINEKA